MKKLNWFFVALAALLLLISCDMELGDPPLAETLSPGQFWAQNLVTKQFYKVDAEKLATGTHCVIWGEKSQNISATTARNMANEYDTNIYQKMLDTFGTSTPYGNILEYADRLGDGDGRLAILLLDIKDGYIPGPGNSYVAGYFASMNFYSRERLPPGYRSNEMDMMYVDAYPGVPGTPQSNVTFAHELQHLMNFATSNLTRTSVMDTWIDEGLATAAEYVYLAPNHTDRIDWFTNDPGGYIQRGNNFFVWDNHDDNPLAILDDYATAYLFFQWLRLQSSNGIGIYKDIITSPYSDYQAVTTAARSRMGESGYTDNAAGWGLLLRDWMAANYIKSPTGRHGYGSDYINTNLTANVHPGGTASISLAPGEGVYSSVSSGSYTIPGTSGNIKYAGLNGTAVNDSGSVSAGNKLLTYNVSTNTAKDAPSGTGTVTGAASLVPGGDGGTSLSLSVSPTSAPFVIGAQDMLRRHGHGDWRNTNFGDLPLVEVDAAD